MYARAVLHRWWVIVLVMVVAVLGISAIPPSKHPLEYTSTQLVILKSSKASKLSNSAAAAIESRALSTGPPIAAAEKVIGGSNAATILGNELKIKSQKGGGNFYVETTAPDTTRANAVTNAIANTFMAEYNDPPAAKYRATLASDQQKIVSLQLQVDNASQQVQNDTKGASSGDTALRNQINELNSQLTAANNSYNDLFASGPPPQLFTVAGPPIVTTAQTSSTLPANRLARALIAALVGAVLAIFLLLLVTLLDGRIRSRQHAERAFGVPVLAEIPVPSRRARRARRPGQPFVAAFPASRTAERYRNAMTSITEAATVSRLLPSRSEDTDNLASEVLVEPWDPGSSVSVMVLSPSRKDGRTTVLANVAAAAAESGLTVIAVDCDLRHPALAAALGVPETALDVGDVLNASSNGALHDEALADSSVVGGITVLPCRQPLANPSQAVPGLRRLLNGASGEADLLLVDSPPTSEVNDAWALLRSVDAAVAVCRYGHTRKNDAWQLSENAARLGVRLLGVVAVGAARRGGGQSSLRQVPLAPASAHVPSSNGSARPARARRTTTADPGVDDTTEFPATPAADPTSI